MNAALLSRLRSAGGDFVPFGRLGGGDVARDLDELSAFGFLIERHPYRGAAYRGPSPRLCPDQIEYELGTTRIGRRVAVWNRVGSTNDLAARASQSAANEGLVVLAEEQTAGRGRRGRVWSAPPGSSVLMSVLLFPAGPLAEPAWLTALGAIAVADVVAGWTGTAPTIKWPNDVRVGGRKVAGVLVERGAGAVVGIGLNANVPEGALPPDLVGRTTSLMALTGAPVDRSELARDLIRRLDALYERSRSEGPTVLSEPWRERSEHLGCRVAVTTPSGPVLGRLEAIDLWDGVRLRSDGDTCHTIAARHVLAIAPDQGFCRGEPSRGET